MGTESGVERHALARAGVELPNHAIGQSFEMTTAAALPPLLREPVPQRVGSRNGIEIAARREKHLCSYQVGFSRRTRRRKVRGLDDGNDRIVGQIPHRNVARNEVGNVSPGAVGGDGNALRILAGIDAAGGRGCRIVQINIPRRIGIHRKGQPAIGADGEFDEQITGGGDGVSGSLAKLAGKGDAPRIGKEKFSFAWFRVLRAQMQIKNAKIDGRCGIGAADHIDEGMRVQAEAQRTCGRRRDVGQIRRLTANDDILKLVRKR